MATIDLIDVSCFGDTAELLLLYPQKKKAIYKIRVSLLMPSLLVKCKESLKFLFLMISDA